MKGALVFLAVFAIVAVITIGNPTLPPGLTIYHMMGQPDTDYQILGLAAPTFAAAILNGVVYGIVVWLIYTVAARATKREKAVVAPAQTPVKTE
jgi:uncharacterized membrane protein YciS (DUF1049 family)